MPHLERKRNLWYARLTIPADAREALGKLRFSKSTGTADKREAQIIANQYVAGWKVQIEQARGKGNESQISKAIQWREELQRKDSDRELLASLILDQAEGIEEKQGYSQAKQFYDVVVGIKTPPAISFAQWRAQLKLEPKTIDQMVKDVSLLIARFEALEDINGKEVLTWLDELEAQGKTKSSRERILGGCRNYWTYLQVRLVVSRDLKPFSGLIPKSKAKSLKKDKANQDYTPSQVVALWNAALKQEKFAQSYSDQDLADLIYIAAYTGGRIEEICSLKITEITDEVFRIVDSKTTAGIRETPIHSALQPIVKRLKKNSKDGYLLSGLTTNKYGDRSNAIGKRFGRLKNKLGYTDRKHTFHSFRSTLITMLENAGINENIAADIVGHEKPRITFGLYSGGTSLKVKKEALEKVVYHFDTAF